MQHTDIEKPLSGIRIPFGEVFHYVSLSEPLAVNRNSEIVQNDSPRGFGGQDLHVVRKTEGFGNPALGVVIAVDHADYYSGFAETG